MSLLDAIQDRVPLVWVRTNQPEKVISTLPSLATDRQIFSFDSLDGLKVWSHEDRMWKIVLMTQLATEEGEEDQQFVLDFYPHALSYAFSQPNALFVDRNAHIEVEKKFDLYSSLYGRYRSAFWEDDLHAVPLQVVCLVTPDKAPPAELASMAVDVAVGLPTEGELVTIIQHVAAGHGNDVLKDQDVLAIASASRGMTELDAIQTYFYSIRTHGVISGDYVEELKFQRMKEQSSLEIVRPTVTFDDVCGLDNAKKLISQAHWIHENPEKAEELGLIALRRFLLVGVPGTGKSYLCQAAANKLGLDLAITGVAQNMNRFVGASEHNMMATFQQINMLAPIAVWVDELGRDLSGGDSSGVVDAGTTSRVHGAFLTGLQQLNEKVFLFAAANSLVDLSPEMLRADRFDKILFVGFPTFEERRAIFSKNLNHNLDYDFDQLAELTPGFTGAEIVVLIRETKQAVGFDEQRHIVTQDIVNMIPIQRNLVWIRHKHAIMNMYRVAMDEHEWASSDQLAEASSYVGGKVPSRKTVKLASSTFSLK